VEKVTETRNGKGAVQRRLTGKGFKDLFSREGRDKVRGESGVRKEGGFHSGNSLHVVHTALGL